MIQQGDSAEALRLLEKTVQSAPKSAPGRSCCRLTRKSTYAHFNPWNIPPGDFDLLVLGIGNSIFRPILTDEVIELVRRVPRSVGVFGTQHREQREDGRGVISGKFRLLTLDVFGRTWPESTPFSFDRDQVSAYRSRVLRVVSGMTGLIAGWTRPWHDGPATAVYRLNIQMHAGRGRCGNP